MNIKKKLLFFFLFNILIFSFIGIFIISSTFVIYKNFNNSNNSTTVSQDLSKIPESVKRYSSIIEMYMKKYNIPEEYLPFILAQATQESYGNNADIFQASESKYNGRIGVIKNPEESIEHAMKRWNEIMFQIKEKGIEFSIPLVLQTYNFGSGYLNWVKNNGNKYTKENAISFSNHMMKTLVGWKYNRYGDTKYVEHIYRYLNFNTNSNINISNTNSNNFSGSRDFQKLINEAKKYLGAPYVFGANYNNAPKCFDCSSFVGYVYTKSGYKNISRTTAYLIFKNHCVPIQPNEAKPGDLVFFHSTYKNAPPISHIGIYVGNNTMIHTGGNPEGVHFEKFDTKFWKSHFYGFGRVK